MKRTDELITQARILSRNSANADGTLAISDEEILQYLNDAQDRMQNLISSTKNVAKIFSTQEVLTLVANQEAYSLSNRVLLNKQIEQVEFSSTGNLTDYVVLEKLNFFNRNTNTDNYPVGYIKRGGQILLQPTPSVSGGTIRVTYERELDDLDIPRGVISSIGSGTSTSFASLTLSAAANSYETTTPGWSTQRYCCVVDAYGTRKAYNIPIASYDTGTNVITPTGSSFTYNTTFDSEIVAGDVAVFWEFHTTFSQLPDSCERYLIHSAAAECFHKDSSNDYENEMERVNAMEKEILAALASQTSEVQFVPQLNRWEW